MPEGTQEHEHPEDDQPYEIAPDILAQVEHDIKRLQDPDLTREEHGQIWDRSAPILNARVTYWKDIEQLPTPVLERCLAMQRRDSDRSKKNFERVFEQERVEEELKRRKRLET